MKTVSKPIHFFHLAETTKTTQQMMGI